MAGDPAAKAVRRLEGRWYVTHALAYSPDGATLASASDTGTIHLWDLATGKERLSLRGHKEDVHRLAYSPDGKILASAGRDGSLRLWDLSTGKERASYPGRQEPFGGLAFAPDGKSLAAFSNCICVWDLNTGKELIFPRQEGIAALWYDSEGRLLWLRHEWKDRALLTLWDLAAGSPAGAIVLPEYGNGKMTLALSPDGRTLATGRHYHGQKDALMSVHLWELATGKLRRQFRGHDGDFIEDLAFSSDGKMLASGSGDSTVLVWDVYREPGERPGGKLSDEKVRQLYEDLDSPDAGTAFASMRQLLAAPRQALPLLRRDLRPVPRLKPGQLTRLITDLDSDVFATRQKATSELERPSEIAEARLWQTLENKPSAEVRRRVEVLLKRIAQQRGPDLSRERLRTLRGLELLEQLHTPEARALLKELATGEPESSLTRQAQAALRRLKRTP